MQPDLFSACQLFISGLQIFTQNFNGYGVEGDVMHGDDQLLRSLDAVIEQYRANQRGTRQVDTGYQRSLRTRNLALPLGRRNILQVDLQHYPATIDFIDSNDALLPFRIETREFQPQGIMMNNKLENR